MTETLPFTINIDGETCAIENWMLVVACALKGHRWAIDLADDPTYDLRGKIKDYERRKDIYFLELDIKYHNKQLVAAYERLAKLEIPNER